MKRIIAMIAASVLGIAYCAAVSYPDVKYGPWVQNVSETGFTVLWKSSQKNFAYVEVAPDDGTPFEMCRRQRFYQVVAGRRIAGEFHSVPVTGLEPGKAYRYRIYAKVFENDENAYAVDYGPERKVNIAGDGVIRTLDRNADKCRFFMLCDIHGKDDNFKALTNGIDKKKYDFLVMNGDMFSYISSADSLLRHVFHTVPALTSSIPTVYTRGNHETRGREAHLLEDICPTPTGEPYFLLRQGPVAFLIIDGGEDKPDSSPEYSGTVDFDTFRETELEWIREAVKDPLFRDAPIKVAVMHIPALLFPDSWYSQVWLNEKFVPVLNEAGVDVMLSGHHHEHLNVKKGDCGNNFPIIANDDTDRLEFEADAKGWHIRTYDLGGKLTHSYDVAK